MVRGRAGRTPAQRAVIRLAAPDSSQPDLADFADFVRSSQAKMLRLAELLTGDRGRAEDLAQDGYAKAYAAWTRIRGGPTGGAAAPGASSLARWSPTSRNTPT